MNSKRVKIIQPEGAEMPGVVEPVEKPKDEVVSVPLAVPEEEESETIE